MPVIVYRFGFSTRTTGFSYCVRIVKPDQPFISWTVQRKRILNSVRPFWSRIDPLHIELYPISRFMDHVRITIESQKIFKTVIFHLMGTAH